MLFTIQQESKVPIFEQIVAQVIFNIASGSLEVGERIQSVRELGQKLVVNPNTVARAYQELERMGVITARRGLGMEVTAEAPELSRRHRQRIIRERLREALREAASSGLAPEEVRQLVDEEMTQVNGAPRLGSG
jgi:GntR family transcriptional regulator